jgi:hypothetical protein
MTAALWCIATAGSAAALTAVHTSVNARRLPRPPVTVPPVGPDTPVAVLLPLRDEADRVPPCLRSLLGQTGVGRLRILILDDDSSDGTAEVVKAVCGDDPRVTLLTGGELPPGWLGKPYACQQLADRAADAAVLVFLDADVVLTPDAVAATVALLDGRDLVSPYPRIVATGAQRLVQPLLQWSWLAFLPLRLAERSPRPSLTAAGGQLLGVRRAAYDRAGGHAAVRDRVLEDIELARAVKRAGGRVGLADGSTLARCVMYPSWAALVDGYTKSMWASFGSPAGAAAVLALLFVLYVVPPVAALAGALGAVAGRTGGPAVALVGLAGYGAGVLSRVIAARATGARAWPDALAHPVSVLLFGWLVSRSFARRGTATWKGRPVGRLGRGGAG